MRTTLFVAVAAGLAMGAAAVPAEVSAQRAETRVEANRARTVDRDARRDARDRASRDERRDERTDRRSDRDIRSGPAGRDRRGGSPAFCRSGEGHPVHGRQWCRDKGFGLGDDRARVTDPGSIWDVIVGDTRDRRTDRDRRRKN